MKKGTFKIHLVDLTFEVSSKRKNQSSRVHLCNKRKCISLVDYFLLREVFHNQTIFVMLNSIVEGKFGSINHRRLTTFFLGGLGTKSQV